MHAPVESSPQETPEEAAALPAEPPRGKSRRWWLNRRLVRLRRRLTLANDTAIEETTLRITNGSRLEGEAPWMLVCSCLLASVGLDINSTAVIIGAMLISPLMSPILGIGLATGVADRHLLLRSARELGFAAVVSLVTSAIYFRLSPLGEPTGELIARTIPTILDVGVAFFGGVAGIVAGSRRQTSMALPGVAIATALMPPICTAGFGLATGRPLFFFGALYLFLLNALFIALATFLVVRLLGFPLRRFATPEARRREVRTIGGVATVAVLPSLWFLYTIVQEQRLARRVDRFVVETIAARGHEVLRTDRQPEGDSTVLKVFIAGQPLSAAELDSVHASRADYDLRRVRVLPIQSDVSSRDLARMQADIRAGVLEMIASTQQTRDSALRTARQDSLRRPVRRALDSTVMRSLAQEIGPVFPEVVGIAWVPIPDLLNRDSTPPPPVLRVRFAASTSARDRRSVLQRISAFAQLRLSPDSVRVESQ